MQKTIHCARSRALGRCWSIHSSLLESGSVCSASCMILLHCNHFCVITTDTRKPPRSLSIGDDDEELRLLHQGSRLGQCREGTIGMFEPTIILPQHALMYTKKYKLTTKEPQNPISGIQ